MLNDQKNTWPVIGNEPVVSYLARRGKSGDAGGTYLFSGPDNLGKTSTAIFFARLLFCSDTKQSGSLSVPCGICESCRRFERQAKGFDYEEQADFSQINGDFHIVKKDKEKKNISIEQVRELIHSLSMSSFANGYKVGIVKHADSLSTEAANALLKTLEEPKDKVVLILVSGDDRKLPATILSRCQILTFRPASAEAIYEHLVGEYALSREKARDFARLAMGRPALARKFAEDADFYAYYEEQVNLFFRLSQGSVAESFQALDEIWAKKQSGQENASQAHRLLEIWQGLARDCHLLALGHLQRTQHSRWQDELRRLGEARPLAAILNLSKELSEAHRYIDANTSPRLVMERLAMLMAKA